MGGGLMQLVAYGAQDIYLTGNPQITFFKVVYRRHTNFAMESVEQTLNGSTTASGRATATVSRNGDLVGRMYIELAGTALAEDTDDNYGSGVIDNVVCEIGGQQIDKQYGHWMEVWSQLTESNPTGMKGVTDAQNDVQGTMTLFQRMSCSGGVDVADGLAPGLLHVPLQFWFNRNPGLALPLIALQYHEVKVVITWSSILNASENCKLWADYIYLDTDERRRFAQVSHEYLIEQVQHSSYSASESLDLNFNHPVKELIWAGKAVAASGLSTPLTVDGGSNDTKYKLVLNGHDRMAERDYRYFTRTQVWQHHTGYGGVNVADSIAVYSFALKPEEHQPSGTCNFSRIDNAQLKISGSTAALNVYAVNYNVLRVMSGMGGLAYSN